MRDELAAVGVVVTGPELVSTGYSLEWCDCNLGCVCIGFGG